MMAKLQPFVTQPEGKNLIQACLNSQHGSSGANNTGNNLGPGPVANGSLVMTSPNLGLSSQGNRQAIDRQCPNNLQMMMVSWNHLLPLDLMRSMLNAEPIHPCHPILNPVPTL